MTTTYTPGQAGKTRMIWAIVIVALVLVVLWNGFVVIPAGHVGVIQRFGALKGDIGEGLHLMLPFIDQVTILPLQIQKYQERIETFSKQQQKVWITIAVNYQLNIIDIQETFRWHRNLEAVTENVIKPIAQQVTKSITPSYPTDQIHLNRDKIRSEIEKKIIDTLKQRSDEFAKKYNTVPFIAVNLSDVNLVEIEFSKEYGDAIERKQVAEQEVLRAEYKRQEASKNKEIAQINAEAKKIEQQLVNQSLTPAILQNRWIEKWNGILPQVMSGTGSGVILNMTDFGKKP